MQQTISIIVEGKVQGVFFRQSTAKKAIELGITGEVSNLPDGSVAIIATGTEEKLEELTAWCRQGPSKAIVTAIVKKELPLRSFRDFSIQRS